MRLVVGVLLAVLSTGVVLLVAGGAARAELKPRNSFGSSGTLPGDLRQPQGVAFTPAGEVWVADTANGRLQLFSSTGTLRGVIGGLTSPVGVTVAPDESIYVADAAQGRVLRYFADGTPDPGFRAEGLEEPRAVAADPRGDTVYVAERAGGRVRGLDARTGVVELDVPGPFASPSGVAVDAAGTLAVSESGADRVVLIPTAGERRFLGESGTGLQQLRGPQGVAFDPYGQVLVADTGNGRVQRFTLTGALVDFQEPLSAPSAVASDGVQGVAVAESGADRVALFEDVLPPPELGRTANAAPLAGTVTFRPPGGAPQQLRAPVQLPLGTEIDTTRGFVRLVTARPKGGTQQATLSRGEFEARQPRTTGIPEALLTGAIGRCPAVTRRRSAFASALLRRNPPAGFKTRRVVRTKVKGKQRSIGRAATGTVIGTDYEVADGCAGTVVTVFEGAVRVTASTGGESRVVRPTGATPGVLFVPLPRDRARRPR